VQNNIKWSYIDVAMGETVMHYSNIIEEEEEEEIISPIIQEIQNLTQRIILLEQRVCNKCGVDECE